MTESFSERYGYQQPAAEISVREDAPVGLRDAIPLIASNAGMSLIEIRKAICEELMIQHDIRNWDELGVQIEVDNLLQTANWYKVYDIAEALYAAAAEDEDPERPRKLNEEKFEHRLNNFFVENGIGWELRDGKIIYRGSEAFDRITREVPDRLDESGFQSAAKEIREALKDISRRPDPDITGAIQHAMAALEATAREVTGQPKPTLGKLVSALGLPAPLDQAVSRLWGFASEHGRHIRERQAVSLADAELIVSVAGALCVFIAQRRS